MIRLFLCLSANLKTQSWHCVMYFEKWTWLFSAFIHLLQEVQCLCLSAEGLLQISHKGVQSGHMPSVVYLSAQYAHTI